MSSFPSVIVVAPETDRRLKKLDSTLSSMNDKLSKLSFAGAAGFDALWVALAPLRGEELSLSDFELP